MDARSNAARSTPAPAPVTDEAIGSQEAGAGPVVDDGDKGTVSDGLDELR